MHIVEEYVVRTKIRYFYGSDNYEYDEVEIEEEYFNNEKDARDYAESMLSIYDDYELMYCAILFGKYNDNIGFDYEDYDIVKTYVNMNNRM